jgi:quinohemoprotein ethanol dehydrogenase
VLAGKSGSTRNISRLLVFTLGGKRILPPLPPSNRSPLDPPPVTGTPAQIAEGAGHFGRYCAVCHGDAAVAGGLNPDLRHSGALNAPGSWQAIVHDGALHENGMVSWAPVMTPQQIETIRLYVIKRANEDKKIGPQ